MEAKTNELAVSEVFETGKLLDIGFREYCRADGINSHGLMDVMRSPAHFYERRFNGAEEKESDALVFGTLFHKAVLEPVDFGRRYVIQPKFDMRFKTARAELDAWQAGLKPDAIVVPEKHVDTLVKMAEKVLGHPVAKRLLAKGVRETSVFWEDEETGERCKGRMDFISAKGHLVDLKTAKDGRWREFSKAIWNHLYFMQVSHYASGGKHTGLFDHRAPIFMVIEKEPPYELALYSAGTSVMAVGEHWRAKAMRLYSKCRKANQWPGYNPSFRTIELPVWAESVDPMDDGDEVEV